MRKNIYVTEEDKILLNKLKKRFKTSESDLYRSGLHALRGEPTLDDTCEELGVMPGSLCPEHNITYMSCWTKHV